MAIPLFSREEILAAPGGRNRHPLAVRLQDVDAAGVVFFARFFEYAHDAFMAALAAGGLDLPRILREGRHLAPIRHAEADYLAPLRFGDAVVAGPVLARVEPTEAVVAHRIERAGGAVVALVQTVHVSVDGRSFERVPFPEEWLRLFRAMGA
jgi:YbgC/YbaW family acyl-CoA thioester hydrolase